MTDNIASYANYANVRIGGYSTNQPKWLIAHLHETYEIYILLEGQRIFFVEDKTYFLKKNDVILLKKNLLHRSIAVEGIESSRISFEFHDQYLQLNNFTDSINLLSVFHHKNIIFNLSDETIIKIKSKFEELYDELENTESDKEIYISCLITEILIMLSRAHKASTKDSDFTMSSATYGVIEYIKDNFSQDLKLENIEDKLNFSKYYLCKIFKKETGFTINKYLNGYRISMAMEMIRTTDDSITDISFNCGYKSVNHFIFTFKTHTKMTPSQYRNIFADK